MTIMAARNNKAAVMAAIALAVAAFFCYVPILSAQATGKSADFAQGEDLFMRNEPAEALPFLQRAFAADPSNIDGALYLAMCYEQLEKFDEALEVYRRILPIGGDKTALIACNVGNIYFRRNNNTLAEQSYTQALRADTAYAPAYLNRANTRVRVGVLRDALQDYERYLALEPAASQRPQIERLINLIRDTFAAEEIRRLMAEEASRADMERRQRLLNETILESMPDLHEAPPPQEAPVEEAPPVEAPPEETPSSQAEEPPEEVLPDDAVEMNQK